MGPKSRLKTQNGMGLKIKMKAGGIEILNKKGPRNNFEVYNYIYQRKNIKILYLCVKCII